MIATSVQDFFFEAMIGGWATTGNKINPPDMPGFKELSFAGELAGGTRAYLLDRWCVNPSSSKSAGSTVIWRDGIPVWIMNYGGEYPEIVIKFLKRALETSYRERRFVGGRGPLLFSENDLVYVNRTRFNDFMNFGGREEIFNLETRVLLGYHDYWGMSL